MRRSAEILVVLAFLNRETLLSTWSVIYKSDYISVSYAVGLASAARSFYVCVPRKFRMLVAQRR